MNAKKVAGIIVSGQDDFIARVNSDLVGKYINIASRCAVFINRKFGGKVLRTLDPFDFGLRAKEIAAFYEQREFGKALREVIANFERGPAIVGVCGKSFKCPPAPSETALMLHDFLEVRGRRAGTEISVVMPFGTPIPPSPDTSKAILAAFEQPAQRRRSPVRVGRGLLDRPVVDGLAVRDAPLAAALRPENRMPNSLLPDPIPVFFRPEV